MDAAENSTQPVFDVRGLTYRYGKRGEAALQNVRISVPGGVAVAILGLSGSGKSTLLAILGRLIEHPSRPKEVMFHSRHFGTSIDYAELDNGASNTLRRNSFGFIMASANMLSNFSCRANIEMPLVLQGLPAGRRRERLDLLIDRLRATGDKSECDKLVRRLDEYPNDVSTGQRQRMAVLRALIHDPEVVFADEPCNSLDPYNAILFRDLLQSWQRGDGNRTLVLVTHNAHEACRVASRIAIVERHGIGDLPLKAVTDFQGPDEIEQFIVDSGRRLAESASGENGSSDARRTVM